MITFTGVPVPVRSRSRRRMWRAQSVLVVLALHLSGCLAGYTVSTIAGNGTWGSNDGDALSSASLSPSNAAIVDPDTDTVYFVEYQVRICVCLSVCLCCRLCHLTVSAVSSRLVCLWLLAAAFALSSPSPSPFSLSSPLLSLPFCRCTVCRSLSPLTHPLPSQLTGGADRQLHKVWLPIA
jgi:hypothetical protein